MLYAVICHMRVNVLWPKYTLLRIGFFVCICGNQSYIWNDFENRENTWIFVYSMSLYILDIPC